MTAHAILLQSARTLYTIRVKDWLLYAYAVVHPFFLFAVFFTRDSVPFWVVVLMILLATLEFIRSGGRFWFDRSYVYLLIVFAVYGATTLMIYFEEPAMTWLGRTPLDRAFAIDLRLLYVIAAFFVFTNFLADVPASMFSRIFTIQLLVGGALALFGIAQYISFNVFGATGITSVEPTNESYQLRSNIFRIGSERLYRSSSVFAEPSFFGFFLIPLMVKSAVAWVRGLYVISRPFHVSITFVFGIAILTNFSFTAVLSAAVLSLFLGFYSLRKSPRTAFYLLVVLLVFVVILILSPFGDATVQRFEQILELRDRSVIDRLVRVYTSVVVVADNPWFGVGPGGYAFWYPRLGGLDRAIMASPLNIWLSFLTDVGLVGFVPLCLFLVSIVRRGTRQVGRHPLVLVYLWSVVAYLVLMTTLDFWFLEMFWFELAMLLALSAGQWHQRAHVPAGNAAAGRGQTD